MVAVEHTYLIRVTNVSPKEIIDEDEQRELLSTFQDLTEVIANDIGVYIYNKYCNEKDDVSVEPMKVCPYSYEEFADLFR